MAPSIRKNLAALVISLAFMVISLPALAVVDKPVIDFTALKVVTDGIQVPVGVAMDAAGYIYVADQPKGGVVKFDKTGKYVMFFKTAGLPQRVAVDPLTSNLVVSEGKYVDVYNNNGVQIRRLKTAGGADFEFKFANGVGVHPTTGEIYVADSLLNVVQKFTAAGAATDVVFGAAFGASNKDKLSIPTELVISDEIISGVRKNRVFVADTNNGRVAVFSDAGVYDRVLCAQGLGIIGDNQLCRVNIPQGIALEYNSSNGLSRVYIADAYQSTVTAVDPNELKVSPYIYGHYLEFIGRNGVNPGDLVVPSGAVYDGTNKRIIVANGYGNLTFYPLVNGQNPSGSDSMLSIFTVSLMNNYVYEPTITISGTYTGANVNIAAKPSTAAVAGKTEYGSGTWQCTISGLVEGQNDITFTGSNGSGGVQVKNVSVFYTKSTASLFVIDPTPPATSLTTYGFTGKIAVGGTITSPTGCTYAAIPGSTTQRSWSCNVALANEGANTINFTTAGVTTPATINRDTLAPAVNLFALADGASTSTQVQNVTGTVSDPYLKEVTISVNGGTAQKVPVSSGVLGVSAPNGVFSSAMVLTNAGANTITIEATDEFSHKNTVTRSITLNTGAPAITVASPADGEIIRGGTITVSGAVSPNATCKVNNVAAGTGATWSSSVTLTDGQFNTIFIECTQGSNTSTVKRTVYRNSGMLELAITDPGQDSATKATSYILKGKVDPLTQILLKTVNGTTSEVAINTDMTFTLPVDLSAGGTIPMTLSALDGVGNASATSFRTIIADTAAPMLKVNYATTTLSSIKGTVEPGAAISLSLYPSTPVNAAVTMAGTSFTAVPEGTYDNLYLLQVTATDQAGNTRTISAGKPDGDCLADGAYAQDDASACLSYVVGSSIPTGIQKAHCDIGPLVDSEISPNGQIDINDCILTLRRVNGLEQPKWW